MPSGKLWTELSGNSIISPSYTLCFRKIDGLNFHLHRIIPLHHLRPLKKINRLYFICIEIPLIIYVPSGRSIDWTFICFGSPLHNLRPFKKVKWLNFYLHWNTSSSFTSLQGEQLTLFIFALEYLFIIYVPSGRWNDWTFICIGSPLHHWRPFRKISWLNFLCFGSLWVRILVMSLHHH